MRRIWRLDTEDVVILLFVFVGVLFGTRSLDDNSTLLHLRTGMNIFESWSVPSTDPYSFTAFGHEWIVQSWFAEFLYGAIHAVGNWHFVILLNVILLALTGGLTAYLARTGYAGRTALAALGAVLVGAPLWGPRPFLFAFLAFALLVLVVKQQRSPFWLIPIMWLWVNTHGSFPIGLAWLVLVAVGQRLDSGEKIRVFKYISTFLVGVGVAAINPVGPKLLTFWTSALSERGTVFQNISEWASPNFHQNLGLVLLGGLTLSVLILARGRALWRYLLPVLVLFAATLWSVRNGAFLSIALAPALGSALKVNLVHGREMKPSFFISRIAAVCVLLASGLAIASSWQRPAIYLDDYPVAALAPLSAAQKQRVLTTDVGGDYRIFAENKNAHVFIDDRYDMYPVAVSNDYVTLNKGTGFTALTLLHYDFTAIVWPTDTSLVDYLSLDPRWTRVHQDKKWTTFIRS